MTGSRKKHRRGVMVALALVLGLMLPASTPLARNQGNPGVIPPTDLAYGLTSAGWIEKYSQWLLSLPVSDNILLNPGAGCDAGQSGPVWFLTASSRGAVTRSCTVPAEKSIFIPMIFYFNAYPCPDPNFQPAPGQSLEDFLTEGAQSLIDNFVTELEMEVDGVSLQNPFKYRATSSLFIFTAHPSVIPVLGIPCLTGSPQPAVSDGYWVMLKPLSVGSHTLRVSSKLVFGDGGIFESDVTYFLQVITDLTIRQVKDLALLLKGFNLNPTIHTSLMFKLQAALSALNAGQFANACVPLTSFYYETKALSGQQIRLSQASQLVSMVEKIRSEINCP